MGRVQNGARWPNQASGRMKWQGMQATSGAKAGADGCTHAPSGQFSDQQTAIRWASQAKAAAAGATCNFELDPVLAVGSAAAAGCRARPLAEASSRAALAGKEGQLLPREGGRLLLRDQAA